MSLVTVSEARALIESPLNDATLQSIIDRVESEVTALAGSPYASGVAPTLVDNLPGGFNSIFTRRPIAAIQAITDYSSLGDTTGTLLEATEYHLWPDTGQIVRLPPGANWGAKVRVTYTPQDDTSKRKQVIIDLLRIVLSRQALQSESVGGEFSYTSPNWEKEKWAIVRKLVQPTY